MRTEDRKALGAYYTPESLAKFLAEWAVVLPNSRVLEPSVGDGALVDAVLARFTEIGSGSLVGYEIEAATLARTKMRFDGYPTSFVQADFLETDVATAGSFDAVIANPPFTRNHAIAPDERRRLRDEFATELGVSGAPGLWVYFICAAVRLLRRGGRMAFIVPGAAAFADYARPFLDALCGQFASVELVKVQGEVNWDGDADERAVFILAEGHLEGASNSLRVSELRQVGSGFEKTTRNWSPPILQHTVLGQLASIEIGVVTGANRYFLLDDAAVKHFELNNADLVPVIARSRHVQGLRIKRDDLTRLAASGEKTLLLAPAVLDERGTRARSYLATIPRHLRKSTRWFHKRRPWWRVQLGTSPHAVLTYMNHLGPRLALLENPITATNTLHRVTFHEPDPARMRTVAISMLSTYSQLHAELIGRVYGGGVLKFELHEARQLPLLLPNKPIDESVFSRIDMALRSGAPEKARELADAAVFPNFFGKVWRARRKELDEQLAETRSGRGTFKK